MPTAIGIGRIVTHYHVWFSTKGRNDLLDNPDIRERTRELMREAAQRHNIGLMELALDTDHAHLLMKLGEGITLANAVRLLKGSTSRYLFLSFPDLKIDMSAFWQKGYGSRRLTVAELSIVRNYIRTHRDRPLRHGR